MIERLNLARISDFRRRTGMTQEQLAKAIGTTRMQICKAEKIQRPLPVSAELKFIELLKKYPAPDQISASGQKTSGDTTGDESETEFRIFCENKLIRVSNARNLVHDKLPLMQKKYQREMETLSLIENSISSNPDDQRLIKKRDEILRLLKSCDLLAQLTIQHEVDVYDAEIKLLEEKINTYNLGTPAS